MHIHGKTKMKYDDKTSLTFACLWHDVKTRPEDSQQGKILHRLRNVPCESPQNYNIFLSISFSMFVFTKQIQGSDTPTKTQLFRCDLWNINSCEYTLICNKPEHASAASFVLEAWWLGGRGKYGVSIHMIRKKYKSNAFILPTQQGHSLCFASWKITQCWLSTLRHQLSRLQASCSKLKGWEQTPKKGQRQQTNISP